LDNYDTTWLVFGQTSEIGQFHGIEMPCRDYGRDIFFLAKYNGIGALGMFGVLGVTWRDILVTAKSRQITCHLPDVAVS